MGNQAVVNELARLSQTVRGLGRDAGRHKVDMANIGLQGARDEYNIGRQTRVDERADEVHAAGAPGRALKLNQDERALEAYNEPVTLGKLMGNSVQGVEHMMAITKEEKAKGNKARVNVERYVDDMGWTSDKIPGAPMVVRDKSGQALKTGEFGQHYNRFRLWTKGNTSFEKRVRGQLEATGDALEAGDISPEQYQARKEKILAYKNNIFAQIEENEKDIADMRRYNQPWAIKGANRLEAKNDALRKEIRMEAARKAAATRKAGLGDGLKYQKEMRANINSAMKIVGNNLGFGEGWGSGMSSMNENQRAAHGNYTSLIGEMAGRGMYEGNPASLARAAIQIDGAVGAEAEKRAGAIDDNYLKKQGTTKDQWIQQTKKQLMQDAMGQFGTRPTIQDNKFKLAPEEIEQIKKLDMGGKVKKTLSGIGGFVNSTGRGSAKPVSQMTPEEQVSELNRQESEQKTTTPLEAFLEDLKNKTPEEKEAIGLRKKERDRKTFLRRAPGL